MKKVFMIGMPSSGKTTYLASLCRLLLLKSQETEWNLDVKDIPEGFDWIKKSINSLDSYIPVDRTQGGDFYNIKLNLYNQNQKCIQFVIPDSSGEIFRDLVYDRRISTDILNQIIKADMLLFFINVNTMIPEERIKLGEKSAIKQLNEEKEKTDIKNAKSKEVKQIKDEEKERKKHNNQSALVDLLQSIVYLVPHSLNVQFIISAWDLVEKEFKLDKVTPEKYIKIKLPLLYQYLISNPQLIDYEIWGISAQGGDFNDKDDLLKLQSDDGENYVYVIDSEANISKDLTKLL